MSVSQIVNRWLLETFSGSFSLKLQGRETLTFTLLFSQTAAFRGLKLEWDHHFTCGHWTNTGIVLLPPNSPGQSVHCTGKTRPIFNAFQTESEGTAGWLNRSVVAADRPTRCDPPPRIKENPRCNRDAKHRSSPVSKLATPACIFKMEYCKSLFLLPLKYAVLSFLSN